MKRVLAMGLGALMVAGTAAPAAAASHIDFSGYYRIMYMNETNTSHSREGQSFTDSYFQDRLNLDLTFSPTDEISVYWRLRGPGSYQRWGQSGSSNKNLYTQFVYGEIKQDWGTVLIGRMSDDLDCAGLCTFGYMPATIPVFTNAGAFDRADIMDGIRYSYDWDNGFSILAQYVKLGNNGQTGGVIDGSSNINGASDQDYDRFQVQGAYAWDGGGASLHVYYDRDATPNASDVFTLPSASFALNKVQTWGVNPSIMHTWGDFSVHFEGMAAWATAQYRTVRTADSKVGTYDQDGSGYGAYLDFDYNYGPGNVTLASWWVSGSDLLENFNDKNKSVANLVGGNFYPLLVAYSGANSNPGSGNRHYGNKGNNVSVIGFANNAYENYVFENHWGRANLLTGEYSALNYGGLDLGQAVVDSVGAPLVAGSSNFVNQVLAGDRTRVLSFNNGTDANHWAIALTGNHAFSDDITMHYGLAYLALNKPNYRVANASTYRDDVAAAAVGPNALNWTGTGYTNQSKDLGYEIDLGVTIQLLDNLSFTSAFGYMFNGDAYKQLKGYDLVKGAGNTSSTLVEHGDNVRARWVDADDSYVWFNSLTFAF